ncbi:hypothetical protein QUB27_30115 [Microcoleus sp. AT8-B6]|uniref:hypothetical protein n=1 Tax=Microcoleus sp. AT8-B6 TaxID=2818622 RepID=UPI002FCEF291
MKRFKILLLILVVLGALLGFWYWADKQDYFQADYKNLSAAQQQVFEWQDGDDAEKLMQRYRQHFLDSLYAFPRQNVAKVKLFRNTPMISALTSKTLKEDYMDGFIQFCNDTTNFHWGETTWQRNESEYYCRLYNAENKVVGKLYFCLGDCGMTSSIPFSPAMKFGGLSGKGINYITQLIGDNSKWE